MRLQKFNVEKTIKYYGSIQEMAKSLGISNLAASSACFRGTINSDLAQKLSRLVGLSEFTPDSHISMNQVEHYFAVSEKVIRDRMNKKLLKPIAVRNGLLFFKFADVKGVKF